MTTQKTKENELPNVDDKLYQFGVFISLGFIFNIYTYPKIREFIKSILVLKNHDIANNVSLIFGIFGMILLYIVTMFYLKKSKNRKLLLSIMIFGFLICGVIFSGKDEIVDIVLSNLGISFGIAYILYVIKEGCKILYSDITESNKTDPIKKYGILIPIITFIIGILLK